MKMQYDPVKNLFLPSEKDILLPQIMWHITDKCLLDCKTCFVKDRLHTTQYLDKGLIAKDLSLLKMLEVQKIDISGGEPLLFDNLQFLVEQAVQSGFYLTITTRGIGLRHNIHWIASNWNQFTRIIVSLDGYCPIICDQFAGYSDTYNKTIGFLKKISAAGCNNIRINTVVNRLLLHNESVGGMCKLMQILAPAEWCLIQPHPLNKRKQFDEYTVTEREYKDFVDQVKSFSWIQPAPEILTRLNTLYSSYWCLYPENIIAKLSNKTGYSFSCELNQMNIMLIVQNINSSSVILPTASNEGRY